MKAIQYRRYGAPEVLHIVDVAQPVPKSNEVLVRVHEAILTPTDISGRSGKPFIVRFFNGLARPKGIPGTDFAGVVEAVGEKVTRFQPGDRVVGAKMPNTGAHAEYVTLAEKGVLTKLPQGVEFSHLAGMCDAAMTALTFLRDDAVLKPGQRVLIIGAAGGIGTFAVQMTKHMGAHVTGVCSTPYVDQVRTLGADAVIDRTKTDFTQIGETYDVIFDAVGKSSFTKCRKALSAKGKYLTTVLGNNILGSMLWTKMTGGKRLAAFGKRRLTHRIKNNIVGFA
ncbi:MAG: NAD(P)-dependent alcohol dehydrogenase, partial [Bacteroidota bacterium]